MIDLEKFRKRLVAKQGGRSLRGVVREVPGVSIATVARIWRGDTPSLDTFDRLCSWMGVQAREFIIIGAHEHGAEPSKPQGLWRRGA